MRGTEGFVFLVDDELPVLKALARVLRTAGLRPVSFDSAAQFLRRVCPATSGCVVLDIAMPDLDGMRVQSELAALHVDLPVIFLSGRADVPMAVHAIQRGAVDFLVKPVDEAMLIEAVRRALDVDCAARQKRAESEDVRNKLSSLTPREREVLIHVVTGVPNKQVAADLGTAEKTIKVHRGRVMEKMGAGSLVELVRLADRAGPAL